MEDSRIGLRPGCAALLLALAGIPAQAEQWLQVGADTAGKYFVDTDSVQRAGENVRVRKRVVYDQPLADTFSDKQVLFTESTGLVEGDCPRRIHRMLSIEMRGADGQVVWGSGPMKRLWEDIAPGSHGEATLQYACANVP